MYKLHKNINLAPYHTFNIPHKAEALFEFSLTDELTSFLNIHGNHYQQFMPIGSGSNLLFTKNFSGCLLKPVDRSVQILSSTHNQVIVKTGAGLEWDDFVKWCVINNLYGLENLSLIPGTTGATPVQNIGAYGVEIKDFITEAEAIELSTGKKRVFNNNECEFDYRDSIFKNELRNCCIFTSVTYKISTKPHYNLDYGAVKREVEKIGEINLHNVRQAIINIRNSKLPDPQKIGNAGSFFKNPIVSRDFADKLLASFPQMPYYRINEKRIKLAAGWLIDQCGLKGYTTGNGAAIHHQQALVLVNKGVKTGMQIWELAEIVQEKVYSKFGINLAPEVTMR